MSQPSEPCAQRRLVDLHFEGRIQPDEERALREHLPGCEACRAYYERHMLLARLDPAGRPMEQRLARGLGLSAPRPDNGRKAWLLAGSGALAAAAAAVLFSLVLRAPDPDDGFSPRGGGTEAPATEVRVYALPQGSEAKPVGDAISAHDELAFAYRSRSPYTRLMIFGVDEQNNVYWFHPAYTDPAKDPEAIPIQADGKLHELKEAVGHDYKGKSLRIVALLASQPLRVKHVEAALQQGEPGLPALFKGQGMQHTQTLRISP